MSEDAEREAQAKLENLRKTWDVAYRQGALDFIEEVKRRFWKANPGGVLYMRQCDSAYWMREIEQEIERGEWPKGGDDAN